MTSQAIENPFHIEPIKFPEGLEEAGNVWEPAETLRQYQSKCERVYGLRCRLRCHEGERIDYFGQDWKPQRLSKTHVTAVKRELQKALAARDWFRSFALVKLAEEDVDITPLLRIEDPDSNDELNDLTLFVQRQLYRFGIRAIRKVQELEGQGKSATGSAEDMQSVEEKPVFLDDCCAKILQILNSLPTGRGLQAGPLCAELRKRNCTLKIDTVRKHKLPKMKTMGVIGNKRGVGYFSTDLGRALNS